MNIAYDTLTKEGLAVLSQKLAVDESTMSVPVFEGFHYFSPEDFKEHEVGTRFIVATEQSTGEVVGVLKFKRYDSEDHSFVSEENAVSTTNYVAVRYVNVRSDCKRRGIAKKLYEELNESVVHADAVIGSGLSEEGRLAKLGEIRKETITRCDSYSSFDVYEDERMELDYAF